MTRLIVYAQLISYKIKEKTKNSRRLSLIIGVIIHSIPKMSGKLLLPNSIKFLTVNLEFLSAI